MAENKTKEVITVKSGEVISEVKNWYYDRYSNVLAQRNLFLLIIILLIIGCIVGLIYIKELTLARTVKPFVIQVEENTGITTVVDSANMNNYMTRNESIKNYFIVKYIRARETYNNADYEYQFDTVARLLSSPNVYQPFKRFLLDQKQSPIYLYGARIYTTILIKSIQYNDQGNVATVRFRINENGESFRVFNKIATLQFDIANMTLSAEERFVNPIGFKVTSYRVDEEIVQ
ncbi:MAG: type IV secretion system protein [Alphaproteobacteria bacterium]|nr:type IV secretion system protein [Alphaproteobacteria bacterium]OJV13478.1 MAG: hypothetical protein BGO27_04630 [Alphaproteobacteria bacterium 33-17]